MQEPLSPEQKQKSYTDFQIIVFIILICVLCGLLLAVVAFSLEGPQIQAKEFDQSKQMLIAVKILNHSGYFQVIGKEGTYVIAFFNKETKTLNPLPEGNIPLKAADEEIKEIAALRIRPLLTDAQGTIYTLKEKNLSLPDYLSENKKTGYANLPLKLVYAILGNSEESQKISSDDLIKDLSKVESYVIPVSGFGLWAPIYGFIALAPDGDKVIGTTWYEHAETPGLGANITEAWWQRQFYGKEVFQRSSDGTTDFKTGALGIIVVKGKVQDVYGNSPKAASAVDGMSGATLTGDGVTQAYRASLTPYRNFFIKVHEAYLKETTHGSQKSAA